MSLGALSPEAHQAISIGMARLGGSANSGEGGEDPAWYAASADGDRRDAAIKQVASARFGVTAEYLARAEQLEIKIAQGSKPGEGGQLPGRKATAFIAGLRRGQPGMTMISPPPHHDIYSIEDLAQADRRPAGGEPAARIGAWLVAGAGIGTIAAGVAKAQAGLHHGRGPRRRNRRIAAELDQARRPAVGLGLAETHQVLVRNRLRDRVALRTDGGLQTGRDVVVAAMLGAEEFGFGTAAGRHRLRHGAPVPSRHLPDRHRHPARGPARQVHRHAGAGGRLLHRARRGRAAELATLGLRSLGKAVDGPTSCAEPMRAAPAAAARGAAMGAGAGEPPKDRPCGMAARPIRASRPRRSTTSPAASPKARRW